MSRRSVSSSATTFYTYDERGSVSQRTSSTGAVLSSDLYDAFGTRTAQGAQSEPWGYGAQAGYYTDTETGLILCTHRYYDPSNGRWLTRDSLGYRGGVNLYGYVGNDPGNRVDPSGNAGLNSGAVGAVQDFFANSSGSVAGLAGTAAGAVLTLPGEIQLATDPNPTSADLLTNGFGGVLAGTATAATGIAAIGSGALVLGVAGAFVLSIGIVVAVVGVVAIGFGLYNYFHPPQPEESCPTDLQKGG